MHRKAIDKTARASSIPVTVQMARVYSKFGACVADGREQEKENPLSGLSKPQVTGRKEKGSARSGADQSKEKQYGSQEAVCTPDPAPDIPTHGLVPELRSGNSRSSSLSGDDGCAALPRQTQCTLSRLPPEAAGDQPKNDQHTDSRHDEIGKNGVGIV